MPRPRPIPTAIHFVVALTAAGCGLFGGEATRPEVVPPSERHCEVKRNFGCYVRVPAATFWMGAQADDPAGPAYDPEALPDEGPPRQVSLGAFWIRAYEAMASDVAKCIDAGACRAEDVGEGGFSNHGKPERKHHAANSVTWQGAADTCRFLGGRLPTEAEWEHAARGTDARRFPWGDEPRCAGVDLKSAEGLPVGGEAMCVREGTVSPADTRVPSPYHVFGMAGNVWEWVADDYAPYGGSSTEGLKVQRGGGWASTDPLEFRVAARGRMKPDAKLHDVGFRCVWGEATP